VLKDQTGARAHHYNPVAGNIKGIAAMVTATALFTLGDANGRMRHAMRRSGSRTVRELPDGTYIAHYPSMRYTSARSTSDWPARVSVVSGDPATASYSGDVLVLAQ
jgi:hypothetical protein